MKTSFYSIILFSVVFLFHGEINSQTYFNKSIPIVNNQYALSIQEIGTGGYLIAGQNLKSGMQTLYFMRTDSNGDTLWTKEYGRTSYYYFGSYSSLNKTSDGNYVFAGAVQDTTGNLDALLIKLNVNGDTLWTKKFGGPYFDVGRDCQQTIDGGYMLVVDNDSLNTAKDDFVLIKTDSSGNLEWKRRYDAGNYEVPICGFQTQDKGYIISGGRDLSATNTSNWIVKTDSLGIMQWSKTYGSGGNDGMCWVSQLNDGKYITTGAKTVTGLDRQGCIRKLNINGTLDWEKLDGGLFTDTYVYDVKEEATDYVFVGNFSTPSNILETVLLKTDTAGNQIWKRNYSFNTTIDCYPYDIKKTSDNGFIISGQTMNLSGDVWLVKIDSNGCEIANCNVGVAEVNAENLKFKIYPNPTSQSATLEFDNPTNQNCTMTLYDLRGQIVQTIKNIIVDKVEIERQSLASGLYFFQLRTDRQIIATGKLTIE